MLSMLRNQSQQMAGIFLHLMEVCLKQQSKYYNSLLQRLIYYNNNLMIQKTFLSSIYCAMQTFIIIKEMICIPKQILLLISSSLRPDEVLGEILRSKIVELLRNKLHKLTRITLTLQNLFVRKTVCCLILTSKQLID